MAMTMNGGRSGGRLARGHDYRPMSEINVTPMVDVMLVLLIIFMVTAPLLTVGVPVDLPKTKASLIPGKDEPLVITIDGMGRVFLQETEIELEKLVPRLRAITANKRDTRIFVRGDRSVFYGQVMEVMGTVNAAGFAKVALIVELPKDLANSKTGKKGK
ncbi:MAG: protein TolR [Proteobacteria bacterium]|nr:protein TolR [Pseudomonadota bacterium]